MKKNKKPLKEVIQYAITGGAWFWSGYAMFALCYSVFGLDIVPAKIISYLFGLAVNFVLERFWVFNDRKARKELDTVTVRYMVISAVNLGIDTGIVWGLNKAGISPYIGQFVSAGFFTVWNYAWYKLWVFARGAAPQPKRAATPALRRPKAVRRRKAYANKRTKR
jgi:putative flippase GtrA